MIKINNAENKLENILKVVEREGMFKKNEYKMIKKIFEFYETIAKNVMVPHTSMKYIIIDWDYNKIYNFFIECNFTRLPVFDRAADNIAGILHLKNFFSVSKNDFDIRKIMTPPFFVPETKKVHYLLKEFQKRQNHMAIVIDEFGSISGLITIEDILEEIVGEIHDEFDNKEDLIKKQNDNTYLVECKIDIEDLNNILGISIPESEDYESLGGFIEYTLNAIPEQNEKFTYDNIDFIIESSDKKKINTAILKITN